MNERLKGGLGRWFWISWGIAMAWSLYRCLTNEASILDDELTHYLISKDVWSDPKELWHPWSRPNTLQPPRKHDEVEDAQEEHWMHREHPEQGPLHHVAKGGTVPTPLVLCS